MNLISFYMTNKYEYFLKNDEEFMIYFKNYLNITMKNMHGILKVIYSAYNLSKNMTLYGLPVSEVRISESEISYSI